MESVETMSQYETISIVVSVAALLMSILIPIFQWVWKKWIMNAIVKYYIAGEALLFFNQSGSYIRINGVLESERKAATIKKMKITIMRKHDERKLNFVWAVFISPVNQRTYGNYIQTTEAAHPFRVEADSVVCSFTEYSDPSDSSGKKIRRICADLYPIIQQVFTGRSYNEAISDYCKSPEYIDAKNSLSSDFFWEIGEYYVDIIIEYGKQKTETFSYKFSVSEQNSMDLRKNIDESLIAKAKEYCQVPLAFNTPTVELTEREKCEKIK
jgi:hypothetical protein